MNLQASATGLAILADRAFAVATSMSALPLSPSKAQALCEAIATDLAEATAKHPAPVADVLRAAQRAVLANGDGVVAAVAMLTGGHDAVESVTGAMCGHCQSLGINAGVFVIRAWAWPRLPSEVRTETVTQLNTCMRELARTLSAPPPHPGDENTS